MTKTSKTTTAANILKLTAMGFIGKTTANTNQEKSGLKTATNQSKMTGNRFRAGLAILLKSHLSKVIFGGACHRRFQLKNQTKSNAEELLFANPVDSHYNVHVKKN